MVWMSDKVSGFHLFENAMLLLQYMLSIAKCFAMVIRRFITFGFFRSLAGSRNVKYLCKKKYILKVKLAQVHWKSKFSTNL
jgi:hypothetical protein